MESEQDVREMVRREVAPLFEDFQQMLAALDRIEAASTFLNEETRLTYRLRRARINCLIEELVGVEDRVVRLAKERFPQWRT